MKFSKKIINLLNYKKLINKNNTETKLKKFGN